MNKRHQQLIQWLDNQFDSYQLSDHFGDASFRSYWRVFHDDESYVVMDAPPDKEDCHPFIQVDHAFENLGLHVPHIYASDLEHGFLLLSDFGIHPFYTTLTEDNVETLYGNAIDEIIKIQQCRDFDGETIPAFDHKWLDEELQFFKDWFLTRYLKLSLSSEQQSVLQSTFELLIAASLEQPQVCIHRDYHSKNLMLLDNNNVGVLDFQDAMLGAITYDLVSLIRDCYIDWPLAQVESWVNYFYLLLISKQQLSADVSFDTFLRWFDLCGMQRHLKAIFIFARKDLRDSDNSYIKYISRALGYVQYVSKKYKELAQFNTLLQTTIMPQWEKTQQ